VSGMSEEPTGSGARLVGRLISAEQYERLAQIGVLGEQVELIEGRIVCGRYPFALSDEAIAAARAHGIELDAPERRPGYTFASLRTPPPQTADRPGEAETRRIAGPSRELARTLAARSAWTELEPVVLALIEGGAEFMRAVEWLAAAHDELDGSSPAGWIAAGRDPERALALANRAAVQLLSDPGGTPIDAAVITAVSELALRLGRVMRPDYVPTWFYRRGIEGLGPDRPIDRIARGDISTVARLVSELEDPGAS
jgi:hypothetical protein